MKPEPIYINLECNIMKLAPIYINFMMQCLLSPDPAKALGFAHWNSPAGQEVRSWLKSYALITDDYRATDRGKAWVKMICSTPLPERSSDWADPRTGYAIELS